MTRVAITPRSFRSTPGAHLTRLKELGLEPVFPVQDRVLTEEELAALVRGCDGLIVGLDPVTAAVLDAGPLRVVVKYGSGMDNIDTAAAEQRGVKLGRTRGVNARSVAELTIALLLALARHVTEHDRIVRQGGWQRRTGIQLEGRLLGVVGYGAIGREVARLGQALGMRVLAYDPRVDQAEPGVELVRLEELLARADAVSLHLPLDEGSRGLFGKRAFELMRPGALFINTARGGIVDEGALAAALAAGHLGGAALDVFEREPPGPSPLLAFDNVIASPHAGSATLEGIERMAVAAVEEAARLLTPP